MTVQLYFYDMFGDLYLVYSFENEKPTKSCHVSNRGQGIPSKHRLTVIVNGAEVVTKKRGFILTKSGRQKNRDLPMQTVAGLYGNPLMGLKIDASPTDSSLPTKVWKQFGHTRVQFLKLGKIRFFQSHKLKNAYTGILVYQYRYRYGIPGIPGILNNTSNHAF
jgi:hypothetical protein